MELPNEENSQINQDINVKNQKLSEIENNRKLFFTSLYTFISNIKNLRQNLSENKELKESFVSMVKSQRILEDTISSDINFSKNLILIENLNQTKTVFEKVKEFFFNKNYQNSIQLYKNLILFSRNYFIFLGVIKLKEEDIEADIMELDIKIKKLVISFKEFLNELLVVNFDGVYDFFRELTIKPHGDELTNNDEIKEKFKNIENDYLILKKFVDSNSQTLKFLIFNHFKNNLKDLGSFIKILKEAKNIKKEKFEKNYKYFVEGAGDFCGFVAFMQIYSKDVDLNQNFNVLITQAKQF